MIQSVEKSGFEKMYGSVCIAGIKTLKQNDFANQAEIQHTYAAEMTSLPHNDNIPVDEEDELRDWLDDPSRVSLMQADSKKQSTSVGLDVRQNTFRSSPTSPFTSIKDKMLLDSLPLDSKLLIESIKETEKALENESNDSTLDVGSKLTFWQRSLEPLHEFLEHVKNLETVPFRSIQSLQDSLPEIIQTIFIHCKRSNSLYGPKFNDLLPQLTTLFRQTNTVFDLFFTILDTRVKFDENSNTDNTLKTVFDQISSIAVLTIGMDLKTLFNTWKAFAKLATRHAPVIKKLGLTECITGRYEGIGKVILTLLHDSTRIEKEISYESTIKCAGMLLKIICVLYKAYRGYCESKVFDALVQLLTKLYRFLPALRVKDSECLTTHIVPVADTLINILVEEKEFCKAFMDYGKPKIEEPISYHLLTLKIMKELMKRQDLDLSSSWLREDNNIVETALTNVNRCCGDFLVNNVQFFVRPETISEQMPPLRVYDATLRLLCNFVARTPVDKFEIVEMTLLRQLLSGEFWCSLVCLDLWTYLARNSSPKLCYEHLSFLSKIQKSLIHREKSLEFEMLSNLIRRLYKLLPEETKESAFRELGDLSNRRFVDPFRESLPPRARQYLSRHPSINTMNNLGQMFQDLHHCPSVKNWTRLTSLLRSIGVVANPNDDKVSIATLRSIWNFNAKIIAKSEGITHDMLLELTELLLDCPQTSIVKNSSDDQSIASVYDNMKEITEYVPVQHRIRFNIFLRNKWELSANAGGKQRILAITKLFCCLLNDDNPWVLQESFETYFKHIVNGLSVDLLTSISNGIKNLPHLRHQVTSYFCDQQIDGFRHYGSLEHYLRDLAQSSKRRSSWHKCYESDFRQRDEKMPRIQTCNLNKRVVDICDDLQEILTKKNELNDASLDRLRVVLLQLLET